MACVASCGNAPAPATPPTPEPPRLELSLHARALAPGEPVRLEVRASRPVDAVEGTFLGRPVAFVRLPDAADAPTVTEGTGWSGWSLIPLDAEAGTGRAEVHAGPATTAQDVVLVAKAFPVEKLRVAEAFVEPPPEVAARLAAEKVRLDALYAVRRAAVAPPAPFVRPVPGEPTGVFGTKRLFNGRPRAPHPGLDLRAASGTPVQASGRGVVALAENLYYSGNTVILDHGGGLFTLYAHLSSFAVKEGEAVEAGTILGRSGATGRVTGPHLHWGAKVGDEPFDPTALLDPSLFP